MSNENIDIEAGLLAETDMAWLINDGDIGIWIPKSQCECEDPDPEIDGIYTFTLPEWLAIEKELV